MTSKVKFQSMCKILPENRHGIAEIQHCHIDEGWSQIAMIRALQHPEEYVEPGLYTQLLVNGQLVMSDTQMERDSNAEFLREVENRGGHILVAGLGLGMILVPIFKCPKVESITVIEKQQDVVDLVLPKLKSKFGHHPQIGKRFCTVITADIFQWNPSLDCRWDVIYFDIWPGICLDFYEDIKRLKKRFLSYLKLGGWMKGWQEDRYRSLLKQKTLSACQED